MNRENTTRRQPRRWSADRLLASIVESSEDAILGTTLDGTIRTWNPAAERLFGYTAEQAVGQPITMLVPPGRTEEEGRIIEGLRARGRIEHFDTERVRSDGTLVPVSVTLSPIRDREGRIVGASTIARDVSERLHAQRSIRESEESFRTLVEQIEDYAIFRTDPEGHATTWNEGVRRILGFDEEDFVGKDITATIFTPEDVEAGIPERELAEAAEKGSASNDRWMRRRNGTRFFASGVTTALRAERGELLGFSKIMRDWSEYRRMQQLLRRSELRYRRLFETAKDGILILDAADGRVIDANPLIAALLARPFSEVVGLELWETGLFGGRAATEAALRDLDARGELRYDRLPVERGGRPREVEVIANVYREDDRVLIQCNVRDVTDRSQLERRAREQAEALEDLHRRKDEFLAMLSHELRNPLAPIANAVQLLRLEREHETPLERQAHAMIERQVGQLTHLVDDLLEVSRITTGRVQLRRERLALGGIAQRAAESVRVLVEQRRHQLEVSVPSRPVWVYADAARLEQVAVNLLTNAIKYTEEGGRIFVAVEQQGDQAVLRVRDTGVGIAADLLPRIFDLFTQAERSLDRSEGGLGIGLSLVQRLVELHDGSVEVASEAGVGSEFTVRLPALEEPRRGQPAPLAAASPEQAPGTGLQVVVVDDNVDAAESLALLLRNDGHEVRTVHDGRGALDATFRDQPDVVLLDIGLPELDGFEVARRIRERLPSSEVVLIAMTGYGQESDREQSREAGFDHHLVKPAEFDALRRILAEVAERSIG